MAEIDIAAVFQLLGSVASDVRELKTDVQELKSAARASDRQLLDLRDTIGTYHASVIGHGVLISELDERLSRVEKSIESLSATQ